MLLRPTASPVVFAWSSASASVKSTRRWYSFMASGVILETASLLAAVFLISSSIPAATSASPRAIACSRSKARFWRWPSKDCRTELIFPNSLALLIRSGAAVFLKRSMSASSSARLDTGSSARMASIFPLSETLGSISFAPFSPSLMPPMAPTMAPVVAICPSASAFSMSGSPSAVPMAAPLVP